MTEVHAHTFSNALVNKARISHGQRKVDDALLSEIARELHLSKQDLLRFIHCEITAEAYADLMIGRGHVRPREYRHDSRLTPDRADLRDFLLACRRAPVAGNRKRAA
jgi:hypothetical protein